MDPAVLRDDMVDGLESPPREVLESEAVAAAMRAVPRRLFLPDDRNAYADSDHEVRGSRVLAPSTVARLLEALTLGSDDDVLVVGAGVGYTAAVCAEIVGETRVHAVDIARPLVFDARENLERAGYGGVLVDCRDGADGLPEYAPFDRIVLEAAVAEPPRALREQLSPGGRVVYPRLRNARGQRLEVQTAADERFQCGLVEFDPLLVAGEQSGAMERNRTAREDREFAARRAESRRGWEQEWIEWDDATSRRSNWPSR